MKRLALFIAVSGLAGCGSPETRAPGAGAGSAEEVIAKTLRDFKGDLESLKPGFPQLAGVDHARVEIAPAEKRYRLYYAQGFVKDDRLKGPTFEKDGCDLMVEIRYPATVEEAQSRPIIGRALPLRNGKFAILWSGVRSEATETGQRFRVKVRQVIDARVKAMEEALHR